MSRRKVLCITLEPICKQMAGPAIRCLELGKQLSDEFDVTVSSPRPTDLDGENNSSSLKIAAGVSKSALYEIAEQSDILFIQANVLKPFPRLSQMNKYLVVDLYDPYLLSLLAEYANQPVSASSSYRLMHQVLERHMAQADFSICASERQRDYWIGRYCALGRLTPQMYKFDPSFRKLIDVVPFGLPPEEPMRTGPGMRGTVAGIEQGDEVLLWGGGIWEWFDPLTVIEAVHRLSSTRPRLKLFFMGWKSPNPQVSLMDMAVKSRELAVKLDILNKHVFFHESWVPYEERINYLLDADAAVSAHFDLPETRFSFRTRILDYLWAGLPIVTTGGDQLAENIEQHAAGFSIGYKDVDGWCKAITELFENPDTRQRLSAGSRELSKQFVWSTAVSRLREYCRNPHKLPAFKPVTMPSIVERFHAVYSRGGKELVLRRSRALLEDLMKR